MIGIMKTSALIGIVIVLVLIAAGAYLLLSHSSSTTPPATTQNTTSTTHTTSNTTSSNTTTTSTTVTSSNTVHSTTGYNNSGYNKTGTNSTGYNESGYNQSGTNKTGTNVTTGHPAIIYTITVLNSSKAGGTYLANETGYTLYLYTPDNDSGNSTCYGLCETYWPPFYAASITVPSGVNASAFGTITRTGGAKQTTYKGWPLYTYVGDSAADQVNGQGVDNTWYAVNINISIPANATK